jgi:transketolase
MKALFFEHIVQQATIDPTLYLIIGDLGFPFAQAFQQKFPDRFINAGIAEQNMIGIAAGLAMAGKNVYVYSIIPFLTMRCFEQIRNDLCYQHLPVKLIGAGGGFSYGAQGITHHALEDIAIMRSLPGMTIVAPANKYETGLLLPQINQCPGPVYLRLSAAEELVPYPPEITPQLGTAFELIQHSSRYIITTGNALDLGYQVQQHLEQHNIACGLANMHTIKPLDQNFFANKHMHAIFTIEEHSVIGGLGQAVAHVLCEQGSSTIFHAFGVQDCYLHEAGPRAKLQSLHGLTPNHIASVIIRKLVHEHNNAIPQTV